MSGKEKKAAALEEKLQLLRSVTKSNSANKTSILVDASKYIKELKDKVELEAAADAASWSQADTDSSGAFGSGNAMPATVSVSSVELESNSNSNSCCRRGFRINVSTERSRPGLLVSVLEALEGLGLDVLDADVSCADAAAFRFQALGGSSGQQQQEEEGGSVDEQMVQQAVLQAISKCMGDDDEP